MENVAIIQLVVLHGFVLSRQLGYMLCVSQKKHVFVVVVTER